MGYRQAGEDDLGSYHEERSHLLTAAWGFTATNATNLTPDNFNSIPTANCLATLRRTPRTDTFTQELSVNYGCLYGEVINEERL